MKIFLLKGDGQHLGDWEEHRPIQVDKIRRTAAPAKVYVWPANQGTNPTRLYSMKEVQDNKEWVEQPAKVVRCRHYS
jgi:hypothetical protein